MKFNTCFERERFSPEVDSGELLVETAGYVPADKLIQRLINAGIRLADYRAGDYGTDGLADGEEPSVDPTADANFDMSDASAIVKQLQESAESSKEETALNTEKAVDDSEAKQTTDVKQR